MRTAALLLALATTASAAAIVACGARTPLLTSEVPLPDAGQDGEVPIKCVPGTFELTQARTQVVLVIDRSGSMDFALDGQIAGGQNSRWRVLERALGPLLKSLPNIEVGAQFFPATGKDINEEVVCQVAPQLDLLPTTSTGTQILDVFRNTSPAWWHANQCGAAKC
jgi:hypothetical protein